MPTYEYRCRSCGGQIERLQRMSDPPPEACPSCGGPMEKMISTVGGVFVKGSGSSRPVGGGTRCGNATPCCGKPEPCDKRPCD